MFRKITITVEGGEARDLVVRLLRTVRTAVPMILEGRPGVVAATQSQIKLEEFNPCLPDSEVKPKAETLNESDTFNPENVPDRRRENGY